MVPGESSGLADDAPTKPKIAQVATANTLTEITPTPVSIIVERQARNSRPEVRAGKQSPKTLMTNSDQITTGQQRLSRSVAINGELDWLLPHESFPSADGRR